MRIAVSGAAPCPWDLAQEWRERTGIRIVRGYGMTELFRPISYSATDTTEAPDAIGRAVPGVELRIVDDELWQWVPDGVSVHVNRLESVETLGVPYSAAVALERSMSRDLEVMARNLRIVAPTCVAYACTSGSFVGGVSPFSVIRTCPPPIAQTTSSTMPRAVSSRPDPGADRECPDTCVPSFFVYESIQGTVVPTLQSVVPLQCTW